MTTALTSDILPQAVLVALACLFAGLMTFQSRGHDASLRFSTFLLQAFVFEAAIVLIASVFFPTIFESPVNRNAFLVTVGMMTLIYAIRDIVASVERWRSPAERPETKDHRI